MSTERHITDQELAERIGKSPWFVQEQCRGERWPHLRVGKSYRFTAEQVTAIDALLEVKVKAADPAVPANAFGQKTRGSR